MYLKLTRLRVDIVSVLLILTVAITSTTIENGKILVGVFPCLCCVAVVMGLRRYYSYLETKSRQILRFNMIADADVAETFGELQQQFKLQKPVNVMRMALTVLEMLSRHYTPGVEVRITNNRTGEDFRLDLEEAARAVTRGDVEE